MPHPPSERIRHPLLMLLSICHYAYAFYTLLEAILTLPSTFQALGIAILPYEAMVGQKVLLGLPTQYLGSYIMAVLMFYTALKWYLIWGEFSLGRLLNEAEGYGYCLTVAGLECILLVFGLLTLDLYPLLGGVLGVSTLLILLIPDVRDHFYFYFYEDGPPREKNRDFNFTGE